VRQYGVQVHVSPDKECYPLSRKRNNGYEMTVPPAPHGSCWSREQRTAILDTSVNIGPRAFAARRNSLI